MERKTYLQEISKLFKSHPIVAILGPRQCGKTTLAKTYSKGNKETAYFDLEDPFHMAQLDNPMLTLQGLSGLIVIDEIQRIPNLFPVLRVLVDKTSQRYLILGSASRELIRQSSESLAGRIAYLELTPFNLIETQNWQTLWLRGGFPPAFLASDDEISADWRKYYIRTFLEQDIPNLGINISPTALRRFWMMLVHYHGNIFNASEMGKSLGISHTAVKNYLDILSGTFMIRQLSPWWENLKKRQVKSPKIYFRDSGLLHSMLNVRNKKELHLSNKVGASWEGFALEEIVRLHQADPQECYFWATHTGAELDLLIIQGEKKWGFEIKYTEQPSITKSMRIAFNDLQLTELFVVYPGENSFPLDENIRAVGLSNFILNQK